jgi:hypothetical protein
MFYQKPYRFAGLLVWFCFSSSFDRFSSVNRFKNSAGGKFSEEQWRCNPGAAGAENL